MQLAVSVSCKMPILTNIMSPHSFNYQLQSKGDNALNWSVRPSVKALKAEP